MRLTFLGTGSAFTMQNFQSNMLLEDGGRRLLIDCGGDVRHDPLGDGACHSWCELAPMCRVRRA